VQTETKRLQRLRRNIVELYLSEQPAAGPVPEVLQRLAVTYGVRSVRYHRPERRLAYCDDSNPFFSFDNAACVSCARCVRACEEIQGTFALTMLGRGFSARPVAGAQPLSGNQGGFADSNCVSCGACVKECPTGAPIVAWAVRSTLVCEMVGW
jgi:formate dehydrogenase major subunit